MSALAKLRLSHESDQAARQEVDIKIVWNKIHFNSQLIKSNKGKPSTQFNLSTRARVFNYHLVCD